jgi:hypothetical protein
MSTFLIKTSKKKLTEHQLVNQTDIYLDEQKKMIKMRYLDDEELAIGEYFKGSPSQTVEDMDLNNLFGEFADEEQGGEHNDHQEGHIDSGKKSDL